MLLLKARKLAKTFGRRRVVNGVDLQVGEQEIVGLLGPNGAGKTTCFRMICGLLDPNDGTVFLGNQEVTSWPMYRRCRDGRMGYLAQESSVFRKLSVEQNLLAVMELLGMDRKTRKQRCGALLEQFEIAHLRRSKADKLSGGERRRLEIARCLVSDPKIIMLDEPFAGIDPITVQNIQSIIRGLRNQGISILITDHAAREILQVTDRCYVINKGDVLCHGSPAEIQRHPEVRRIYLGDMDADESGPPPPHMLKRREEPARRSPSEERRRRSK
ncbi:MAG: LPS export ABC transporter ATP-binding protein [Pirellulaceae bacterium]